MDLHFEIPAYAGMTERDNDIPACSGMTERDND
jgi:hypothetical protein